MAKYKLAEGNFIIRTKDGANIPTDVVNVDYRKYLVWITDGNTPDPADILPIVSDEDLAEQRITGPREMRAFIAALADEFSITPRALLDKIRAKVGGV